MTEEIPWWADPFSAFVAFVLVVFLSVSTGAGAAVTCSWSGTPGDSTGGNVAACIAAKIATLPTSGFGCHASSSASYSAQDVTLTGGSIFATMSPTPACSSGTVATISGVSGTPDADCTGSSVVATGLFHTGTNTSPQMTGCTSGCETGFSGAMHGRALVGGVYHYYFSGNYAKTGQPCTTGSTPSPAASIPGPTCGAGQSLGTVNGVQQCFTTATGAAVNPTAGTTTPGPTVTTTAAPGGGTTTVTVNPDGSTRTVDRDADGNTTNDVTAGADPLQEYCRLNPRAPACSSTSFGGSCASAFTCEGDAATCAAARAVNELNCKMTADPTKTPSVIVAEAGLSTAKAAYTSSGSSSDITSVLKMNDRSLAAASCPPGLSVSVLGSTLIFPLTPFCELAGVLSVFIMLGAFLLSSRILFGGV